MLCYSYGEVPFSARPDETLLASSNDVPPTEFFKGDAHPKGIFHETRGVSSEQSHNESG